MHAIGHKIRDAVNWGFCRKSFLKLDIDFGVIYKRETMKHYVVETSLRSFLSSWCRPDVG
jgi:hypothetical protein